MAAQHVGRSRLVSGGGSKTAWHIDRRAPALGAIRHEDLTLLLEPKIAVNASRRKTIEDILR
jgi:hypothetical protein